MLKKSRTGFECYEVLGPEDPLPFIFSLMQRLTRPLSFCLTGRSFVLKPLKPHTRSPPSRSHMYAYPYSLVHIHLCVRELIHFIMSKKLHSQVEEGYLTSMPFLKFLQRMCYQHNYQSRLLSFISRTIWGKKQIQKWLSKKSFLTSNFLHLMVCFSLCSLSLSTPSI